MSFKNLSPQRYLYFTFPVVLILVLLSVIFWDRPLASLGYDFFYTHTKGSVGKLGAILTMYSYCIMLLIFILYFYLKLKKGSNHFLRCLSLLIYTFILGHFADDTLKFVFARTSPLIKGHLSFMMEKYHYSFGLFDHGGASFPSGHMTLYMAFATAVLLYYPKVWPVILAFGATLFAMLLFLDLHYLSDLIAGAYLGTTITLGIYYMRKHDPDYRR